VITVSALSLFREYGRNEVATDMRLEGKIVEIQGMVTGINKDFWDSIYVTLRTPNEFMSASVRPIDSDVEKIARLRKGQAVTFRCAKMRRLAGSPSGSNCALMND
jgi:tRNA_anti-like